MFSDGGIKDDWEPETILVKNELGRYVRVPNPKFKVDKGKIMKLEHISIPEFDHVIRLMCKYLIKDNSELYDCIMRCSNKQNVDIGQLCNIQCCPFVSKKVMR